MKLSKFLSEDILNEKVFTNMEDAKNKLPKTIKFVRQYKGRTGTTESRNEFWRLQPQTSSFTTPEYKTKSGFKMQLQIRTDDARYPNRADLVIYIRAGFSSENPKKTIVTLDREPKTVNLYRYGKYSSLSSSSSSTVKAVADEMAKKILEILAQTQVMKVKELEKQKGFADLIYKAVDSKLEIDQAFCWEGSAGKGGSMTNGNRITYSMGGSSTVEHEGDVSGIYSQVQDLRGKSCDFKIGRKFYKATIVATTCKIQAESHEDEDYEVDVRGSVTIEYQATAPQVRESVEQTITLTSRNGQEIVVEIEGGRISSITNPRGLRFPYVVGQPFNRGMEVFAENNGYKWNGQTLGDKKVMGIRTKDIPAGHELRHLYPHKFR